MKTKSIAALIASALFIGVTMSAFAQELSVAKMAPSVVKTVPECGDLAVDPSLNEIRVTFSKDMQTDRMWSFCQISKDSFPEKGSGSVHYVDKRTCVMPVKLQPGKTYVIWINRAQFNAFRDTKNNPSIPYQLVFQTSQ